MSRHLMAKTPKLPRAGDPFMKKLLAATAGAFVALSIGAARAADLPTTKAPPVYTPPPQFIWTGFYVGAALGGKLSNATWATTSLFNSAVPQTIDASSPRYYDPSSVRAGGYLGYNWQFAPRWVGGVEADVAYADKTVTAAGIPGCAIGCVPGFPGPGVDSASVKLGWDASLRGRLGYLVTPRLLAYGTGGIAWQNVQTSATCQHSAPDPLCLALAGNPFATATNTTTRTGWTIGGGVDAQIYGNWILRGDYRYAYFGTWNNSANLSIPGSVDTIGYRLKLSTQILTLGLAYKF
jgi:outer membrane immunogenic protein